MKNLIKKILKEEFDDFGWTKDVPAKLNTYRITYRMEMYIDAHTEEEATEIYESMDLGNVHRYMTYDEEEVGMKDYQWYETTSIERTED
jgi:hypothetical protein